MYILEKIFVFQTKEHILRAEYTEKEVANTNFFSKIYLKNKNAFYSYSFNINAKNLRSGKTTFLICRQEV